MSTSERRSAQRPWRQSHKRKELGSGSPTEANEKKYLNSEDMHFRKPPEFTEAAWNELRARVGSLLDRVEEHGRKLSHDRGYTSVDQPHVESVWEDARREKTLIRKRIGWLCGIVSGGSLSYILSFIGNPSGPIEYPAAAVFLLCVSLIVGWESMR